MKKYSRIKMPAFIVVLGLVFGFLVLGVSAVSQVVAVEGVSELAEAEIEVMQEEEVEDFVIAPAMEAETQATDYYLPYPGILPDHPMYWLKMVRDRVQLWLTTSSTSKVSKQLLYADKRLGAGFSLIEGNKISLGVTTLTKAEKYLEQAVNLAKGLNDDQVDKTKLAKAVLKHKEVLGMVKEKVGDEQGQVLNELLKMDLSLELKEEISEGYKLIIDDGESVVEFESLEARTALELLRKGVEVNELEMMVKEYDFGSMVESINGLINTKDKAWIYYVNGESATVGADQYELNDGDEIEWKYTKPLF